MAALCKSGSTHLPQADLVYVRFHLSEHLTPPSDQTRRAEHKQLAKDGDERLKQTRYLCLRAPETLTATQRDQLEKLGASSLATLAAWRLKAESLDGRIQQLKAKARGFKSGRLPPHDPVSRGAT